MDLSSSKSHLGLNETVNDGVAHSKIYTLDLAAWYLVWKESVGPNDAS